MTERKRYWAYIRKNILGPFTAGEIAQIEGFGSHTLVSPENALGQWRECSHEDDFSIYLELKEALTPQEKETIKRSVNENIVFKKILEENISKNKYLEREMKRLSQENIETKKKFESMLAEKEEMIRALKDAVEEEKKKSENAIKGSQWERLYAELKVSSEKKLNLLKMEKAKYLNEIEALKNRIQSTVNAYEASKNKLNEKHLAEKRKLEEEIIKSKNSLEEKEVELNSLKENMKTLILKNNELHKILSEEKREKEKIQKQTNEEIACLTTELSLERSENEKLKKKVSAISQALETFENEDIRREKEQQEFFKMIHSKIKLLNSYFAGLESRLRKAEE